MSFEELCFAIVGVVSISFTLAAFIGMLRESKQMDDEILNYELNEARLQDKIESQESLIRQAKANINLLKEENARLRKECIVLHRQEGQEAEDGQKEQS
ncbi:hypothetical protein [Dialister succinatiphilus]|uniref:hypothetical protein n=1 Tax=Dialister succinatiphilus TaxID=487173 RepID=UPI003F80913D